MRGRNLGLGKYLVFTYLRSWTFSLRNQISKSIINAVFEPYVLNDLVSGPCGRKPKSSELFLAFSFVLTRVCGV